MKYKSFAKNYSIIILIIVNFFLSNNVFANQDIMSLFPLTNYSQKISDWLDPAADDYDKPIMTDLVQMQHVTNLREHYFGKYSPWNQQYIIAILKQTAPNDLKSVEKNIIQDFDNDGKDANQIGYGANFRPYEKAWIEGLAKNIDVNQFDQLTYDNNKRAITIKNIHARVLPTNEVHFYSYKLPGQGYPFDNLQMSALWVGTPVYVLIQTQDKTWSLVVTPDYIAWVPSDSIAWANDDFIKTWQAAATTQLGAITRTKTPVIDSAGNYLQTTFIGTILPAQVNGNNFTVLFPMADNKNHAQIITVSLTKDVFNTIPVPLTKHNLANIMTTLNNRPYGWGGMYFYNDCSAELKSLLTPFGIYLARHSSEQVKTGRMVDMSSANEKERIAFLMEKGKPFLNIVYIGGHVFFYIGNYPNPNDTEHAPMIMTYQNIWGLRPNPPVSRTVIGKALFFPILSSYPEDPALVSLANGKYFQVSYLDEINALTAATAAQINLRILMYPQS